MSIKVMSRVWEKSKVGGSQLLLLLAISDNANDAGVAWPGQTYLAQKIRMSKRSVPRLAAQLQQGGDLFVYDRGAEGRVTQYIVTLGMAPDDFEFAVKNYLKFNKEKAASAIKWFSKRGGRQVVTPDTVVSGGVDTVVSGGVDTAMSTEPSITVIEPSFKKTSADADYLRPISFLSLEKIKTMEMTIKGWIQALEDEMGERGRKGVIKFVEAKVKHWQLMPRSEGELKLFEILEAEYEADGRAAPKKFPSLETKRLFNEGAEMHNGTLESVIKKAIHKRGKAIAKITDYINSPKWKDDSNGRTNSKATRKGQSEIKSQARNFEPGNGRSPELQARLEAAFAIQQT